MPDSLGPALAGITVVMFAAVFLYAAYWAFAIRRKLIGRLYRNHALCLGLLCIFALIDALPYAPSLSSNMITSVLVALYSYLPWVPWIVFAFIDSTIPVLRRSDPLLRYTLHWRKLRVVLWALLVFGAVIAIWASIYFPSCVTAAIPPNCILSDMSSWGSIGTVLGFLDNQFTMPASMFAVAVGAVALLIGARRSKDTVLRRSVKWLGAGLCLLPVIFLLYAIEAAILSLPLYYITYSYGAVPLNIAAFLAGYTLYRSARSLAPLNRLPPIEPEITPCTTEAAS